ncbi:MAG TPA: TlpA disulfide reductase family protein [Anaeromyxobacteraceae bacterium]|nr:TlpA disulfide reductase family protein [Anaeromyxobacteraceae bacterium]
MRTAVMAGLLALAAASGALEHPEPGTRIESEELPPLGGGARRPLLEPGRVTVFVFVRPGHDHSEEALARLAALEREFAPRVRFVAVVSGDAPEAAVRSMAARAGASMPVLVDPGDQLYGRLGVRVHPLTGVVGADGRLVAWEPFQKVNQGEVIRACIREALGEISAAEAAAARAPSKGTMPGDDPRAVARRDVKMGQMLLERGSLEPALRAAERALARDPEAAGARSLAGRALAGMGRCADAIAELERALAADPSDAAAAAARKGCSP